jgi:Anti-sigma-28 factor, FlgM
MSGHCKDRGQDPPGSRPVAPAPADLRDYSRTEAGLRRLARGIISRTPEVRPEKVARLKEAIAQGAYGNDTGSLADIIIAELIRRR